MTLTELELHLQLTREANLEMIMEKYGRRVLHLIYLIVKDRNAAEDITQEVFIKVYRHMPYFRGECSMQTWVCKIAVNEAKKHVRSWWFRNIFSSPPIVDLAGSEKDVWSEMHYRRPHINGPTVINDVILDYSIGNEPVKIGDHLYAGILSIFPRAPLPDTFDLELEAPSVGVIGGSGKWKWQLPVTLLQRLKEAQRTIHPQVKLEWNGLKISVEEVQVSQSGTDLVVLASGPTEKLTKLDFTGMDEHMTLIDGGLRYSDKIDEQTYRYQLRFLISPKRNSFLNLIPRFGYTVKESTSQEFRYDLQGAYPISLPKENGGALVTRVDFMSDKTVVHYQVQDPFQQLQFLMIEDEKGTRLHSNHVYPIRESTESFSFRYEFPPVNPQQKIKLLTTVNTTTLEENVSNYEGTTDMRRTQIKIPL